MPLDELEILIRDSSPLMKPHWAKWVKTDRRVPLSQCNHHRLAAAACIWATAQKAQEWEQASERKLRTFRGDLSWSLSWVDVSCMLGHCAGSALCAWWDNARDWLKCQRGSKSLRARVWTHSRSSLVKGTEIYKITARLKFNFSAGFRNDDCPHLMRTPSCRHSKGYY